MTSKVRRVSAEFAVALTFLVWAVQSAAQETAWPVVTVVVRGQELVDGDVLQQSMSVVSRIYRQIGVEVAWVDPEWFAAQMPGDAEGRIRFCRRVVTVHLSRNEPPGPLAYRPNVLGVAAMGARFAYVFVERVTLLADRRRIDAGDLLGHVMAHEIGHLLLPAHSHSASGLMRADLNLELVQKHRLEFAREEGALIRARIVSEMRAQTPSIESVAGAGDRLM